jgi:hypothetical protein
MHRKQCLCAQRNVHFSTSLYALPFNLPMVHSRFRFQ